MTFSKSCAAVSIFALTLLVAARHADAQRRGQGGLRLGNATAAQLLQLDTVQKELKVTDEQKSAAAKISEALTSGRRQLFAATAKDSNERGAKLAELNKQADADIDKLLDDAQRKRLREIVLQVNGGAALEKEDVQKALKLSDEQKAKLTEMRKENAKSRRDGLAKLEGAARNTKEAELYREGNKKLLDILTPEQNKQFEQMQGQRIKLDLSESSSSV